MNEWSTVIGYDHDKEFSIITVHSSPGSIARSAVFALSSMMRSLLFNFSLLVGNEVCKPWADKLIGLDVR